MGLKCDLCFIGAEKTNFKWMSKWSGIALVLFNYALCDLVQKTRAILSTNQTQD